MAKGGIPIALVILLAGGAIGLGVSLMLSHAGKLKSTVDFYISDLETINMVYQARNVQEYLETGSKFIIRDFYESGGPDICGSVMFEGRMVSVWKSSECGPPDYSEGVVDEISGRAAAEVASEYGPLWGTAASYSGGDFCMSREDILPFGMYGSKVCFPSTIRDELEAAFRDMIGLFDPESHDCGCFGNHKVCWSGGEQNFTYAVVENC